jgi:hypothetical protein
MADSGGELGLYNVARNLAYYQIYISSVFLPQKFYPFLDFDLY